MNSEFLEIAARLGGRLCRDAVWSGGLCNWISPRPHTGAPGLGALRSRLYTGTAGVALSLWRLARATGDSIVRETAEGAIRCALSRPLATGWGFYSGAVGLLYAAAEILGEIDPAAVMRESEPDPSKLDILSGSAGVIPALLWFQRRSGGDALLDLAVRHGDLLLAEAVHHEQGWSWTTMPGAPGATGFAHGAAGIAWSLAVLGCATGEPRFRDAALEGFRYERSCFDAAHGAWRDYRDPEAGFPSVWCHGSAGIGLSRLAAWQALGDPALLEEARLALAHVRGALSGLDNFSLCHGAAGCADLFLEAAHVLGEPEWRRAAEEVGRSGIERYERPRRPWPGGMQSASETPDLMWGNAGIAWFFLRLADSATATVLLPRRQ
jgi:lantibiotic modifying enzyme